MAGLFQQLFGTSNSASSSAPQAASPVSSGTQPNAAVAASDGSAVSAVQVAASGATADVTSIPDAGEPAAGANKSPLDNYLPIWNTAATPQEADPLSADVIPLGADQLQALQQKIASVNFLGTVPQETITNALNGDAAAFSSAINAAVQQALMQAVRVNGAMLNAGFKNRTQDILAAMPKHVQQALVTNQIRQDNPVFNHPAARQVLSALEQNLATSHPGISPAEASQVAQRFLQDFASEIAGKPQSQSVSQTPGQIDWSTAFK